TQLYHNDHLWTPQRLTDTEGSITWRGRQEAFGKTESITDNIDTPIDNPLRFPGQYHDEETGTHYNFHRDYLPETGRYVESDPIGLEGGISTYSYAQNSSLRFVDSFGLFVCLTTVDCACIKDPK